MPLRDLPFGTELGGHVSGSERRRYAWDAGHVELDPADRTREITAAASLTSAAGATFSAHDHQYQSSPATTVSLNAVTCGLVTLIAVGRGNRA